MDLHRATYRVYVAMEPSSVSAAFSSNLPSRLQRRRRHQKLSALKKSLDMPEFVLISELLLAWTEEDENDLNIPKPLVEGELRRIAATH